MSNTAGNLLESIDTYKDLFDNAHDLIHLVQIDGHILYVNKAWMRLIGYEKDVIQGQSIFNFIAPEDKERYFNYRQHIISGGEHDGEIIVSFVTSAGEKILLEGFVSVKFDSNNQPLYTRGIFRDITAKHQNEEKLKLYTKDLQERESSLKNLLLNAPDAVVVIDQEGMVIYWNPKATAIFGFTADEVNGRRLSDLIIPPQYREAHNNGMKHYLATGEGPVLNNTIEITALKKSGEEFYVSLTISNTQQQGKIAFVAFVRDISLQKKNALELQQSVEALKRSNQSLEEFAHAASHDLKEPIRKVHTFADMLKNSLQNRMNATEENLFIRLEVATDRMRLLVDDLLEYSHVTIHPIEKEQIDLNDKMVKVLDDLELAIKEKNAVVEYHHLPVVPGYRRQLQQLFQNLISNALKYSKQNIQPHIIIQAEKISGNKAVSMLPAADIMREYFLITVEDNGIGFEARDADKIFKMFSRLHDKTSYAGTGVGLTIARKVVENHQGFIWANAIVNQGATFYVLLPA